MYLYLRLSLLLDDSKNRYHCLECIMVSVCLLLIELNLKSIWRNPNGRALAINFMRDLLSYLCRTDIATCLLCILLQLKSLAHLFSIKNAYSSLSLNMKIFL